MGDLLTWRPERIMAVVMIAAMAYLVYTVTEEHGPAGGWILGAAYSVCLILAALFI